MRNFTSLHRGKSSEVGRNIEKEHAEGGIIVLRITSNVSGDQSSETFKHFHVSSELREGVHIKQTTLLGKDLELSDSQSACLNSQNKLR